MELPENVIAAISANQKIEAIKLLRIEKGVGLAEAKAAVDAYISEHPAPAHAQTQVVDRQTGNRYPGRATGTVLGLGLLASFVWMMISFVSVAGSLIVYLNRDGYQQTSFNIENVFYQHDHENGLTWGFTGHVDDRPERMLAPDMADAESLNLRGLKKMFPAGTNLSVLYNPEVTDTLFQKRSLNIIPFVADIAKEEKKQLVWWLKNCVLPFLLALLLWGLFARKEELNTGISKL